MTDDVENCGASQQIVRPSVLYIYIERERVLLLLFWNLLMKYKSFIESLPNIGCFFFFFAFVIFQLYFLSPAVTAFKKEKKRKEKKSESNAMCIVWNNRYPMM